MRIKQDVAHNFFKEYAFNHGFAVRKEGRKEYLSFLCVHGGKYLNTRQLPADVTPKDEATALPTTEIRRREIRTRRIGCEWKVRCALHSGEYTITAFTDNHNHPVDPMTRFKIKHQVFLLILF